MLLQRLRANNVFAPPPMQQPQPPIDLMNTQQPLGPMSVNQQPQMNAPTMAPMNNNSEGNASAMYDEAIRNMPEREKPGILRKIAASMVGLGREGTQGAQRVLDAPYNEKMDDWNQKIKALQPGMQMEKQGRINERLIESDKRRYEQGDERIRQGEDRVRLAAEKNANIYETKQKELTAKIDDAQRRLDLAERSLTQRGDDANTRAEIARATIEATNARHELTMTQRDKELKEIEALHKAQIEKITAELDQIKNPKSETEQVDAKVDANGNIIGKTTVKTKGAIPNKPLSKTQTNTKTGAKRTLISNDGGKTWQVKQ